MEITGLSTFLLSQGVLGAAVLYLLWDRGTERKRLDASQAIIVTELIKIVGEVKAALVTSTETARATNAVQDRAATSAGDIAHALIKIEARLEHFEETIERLDQERRP